jgi:hypothetical protein
LVPVAQSACWTQAGVSEWGPMRIMGLNGCHVPIDSHPDNHCPERLTPPPPTCACKSCMLPSMLSCGAAVVPGRWHAHTGLPQIAAPVLGIAASIRPSCSAAAWHPPPSAPPHPQQRPASAPSSLRSIIPKQQLQGSCRVQGLQLRCCCQGIGHLGHRRHRAACQAAIHAIHGREDLLPAQHSTALFVFYSDLTDNLSAPSNGGRSPHHNAPSRTKSHHSSMP